HGSRSSRRSTSPLRPGTTMGSLPVRDRGDGMTALRYAGATMNALRLSATVLSTTVVLALAAAFGGSPSCAAPDGYVWLCGYPDGGVIGNWVTSDSAERPCNSLGGCALIGPVDVDAGSFPQGNCSFLDGGEGGPIPACDGQCVPNPPTGWGNATLLWFGDETK